MPNRGQIETISCPLPLRDYPNIVMGHGGGGKLSAELVEHLFLPAFGNEMLDGLSDASVMNVSSSRIAMSTDSYVVRPLFFPGGSIGELAVNGTVNDLAMVGAKPRYLSVGFILEEGLSLECLTRIVDEMARAAANANVRIVTGDTKVVDRGHGDGCYINTAGVGIIETEMAVGPQLAQPGDSVIVSGTIGDHGMAIMSVREGLEFESVIESDTASLAGLVQSMLSIGAGIHVLRDPTRGGVASSLNEIASASNLGIVIDEQRLPIKREVQSACDLLGLEPLYVANEGKLIAIVEAELEQRFLEIMHQDPLGKDAAVIGQVVDGHPGMLVIKTSIGAKRIVPMQIGEQLPRIC